MSATVVGDVNGLSTGTAQLTLNADAAGAGPRGRAANTAVVGKATARFGNAGRGALTIKLNRRERKLMGQARRLKVKTKLVFAEDSGRRTSKTATITLKRKRTG